MCWRSDRDGASMLALNRKSQVHHARPMVLVILTVTGEVLGGYSPKHFSLTKADMQAVDPADSFLFTLRPFCNPFYWTGANRSFIDYSPDGIMIGGDDIALWISADVRQASSRSSQSFDSPQLAGDTNGDFLIRCMEIWTLR